MTTLIFIIVSWLHAFFLVVAVRSFLHALMVVAVNYYFQQLSVPFTRDAADGDVRLTDVVGCPMAAAINKSSKSNSTTPQQPHPPWSPTGRNRTSIHTFQDHNFSTHPCNSKDLIAIVVSRLVDHSTTRHFENI